MRRSVFALSVIIVLATSAALTTATPASAVGPGGWDHVGVGATSAMSSLNGAVYTLNTENPGALYVGGNFTSAGGNTKAARIARWNGSTWNSLGATPLANGAVNAIAHHGGKVYAGGTFINAGGNPNADFLAMWNGSSWAPFCNPVGAGPAFHGTVNALQIIGNTLYVGGAFQDGAGIDAADYLVACNLTTGASSSTVATDGDFEGAVYALTADSNGVLYAAGQFINVDNIEAADHVAAYNGAWHAMGTGGGPGGGALDDYARSITAVGTNVYVGTDSLNVGGIARADHVARWNGTTWSAVGSNPAGTNGWFPTTAFINSLTTYGSSVFAAGSFQNAGGVATADEIAYFDGTGWRPIGSDGAGNGPLVAQLSAVKIFNGKVFAGGNFTKAGGDARGEFLAAYALRLPDSSISRQPTSHYVGNSVYSPTGAGEARIVNVVRGHAGTAYVRIQNDGLVPASFAISGTGGARGITAHYYRGRTDITTRVRAGTYATGTIAARGYLQLRLRVTVAARSAAATTFVTTARSVSGTPADAVRASVRAH